MSLRCRNSFDICNTIYLYHHYCSLPSHHYSTLNRSKAMDSIKSEFGKKALNPIPGSTKSKRLRNSIHNAQDIKTIKTVIKTAIDSGSGDVDQSVFGAAMQKCSDFKEWKVALKVFNTMHRIRTVSLIEYNIIIDALCKNDQLHRAISLLNSMESDGIEPDIAIFNALIIGCKHRKNEKLALNLWSKLHSNRYSLKPDLVTYNSMISVLARSKSMDKAETLWTELLMKSKDAQNGLTPDAVTCAAMMNGYSIQRNRLKLVEMQHFMESNAIPMTAIHFSAMLKYFLLDERPMEGIDFFQHEITRKLPFQQMSNQLLIHQLCCCYLQLMESGIGSASKRKINQYHTMITQTIPKQYGIEPEASLVFDAQLIMYEGNWIKLIPEFQKKIESNLLHGYWNKSKSEGWIVDLHRHSLRTASFIIKYVFVFEGEFIRNEIMRKNQSVLILCGKGVHNDSAIDKADTDKEKEMMPSMARRVETELMSWSPPIKVTRFRNACCELESKSVVSFLSQEIKAKKRIFQCIGSQ